VIQSPIQHPKVAVGLIKHSALREQAVSIVVDLLKEYSALASKSDVGDARRWDWRESVRTNFQLILLGFLVAPWGLAGAVLGGIFLF
jgi:hypothetical protein